MKRAVKAFVAAAAALALMFAFCGCSAGAGSYTPEKKEATVAAPVIGEDGILRVGVNSSNAPFSAQVSGSIVGIDVDMAAAVADELGLSLEIVDVGSDPEGALNEGTVDIVMGIASTDSTVSCKTSKPYISSASAIFSADSEAKLPTGEEKDLAIEAQSSSMSAWVASNQFGDETVKSVDDLKGAFDDLSSGKASYVAADAIIGSYVANSNGIEAFMIGLMESPTDYSIGVLADNADLLKAVNGALDALSQSGMIDIIEKKWLGFDLDLSSMPKTEGAVAEDAESDKDEEADDSESGDSAVGSNAVVLQDDGSTQG